MTKQGIGEIAIEKAPTEEQLGKLGVRSWPIWTKEPSKFTISFGRRLESVIGRMYLLAIWKNFIKIRSERRPDRTTPAMALGLTDSRWRWERILARRLFRKRVAPSDAALKLYWKRWTPHLPELDRKHAA